MTDMDWFDELFDRVHSEGFEDELRNKLEEIDPDDIVQTSDDISKARIDIVYKGIDAEGKILLNRK